MPTLDEAILSNYAQGEARVSHEPIPFDHDSILFEEGESSMGQLVVLGLAGVIHRGDEAIPTFTAWVQTMDSLTPEEFESAVFADEFVGPDGHLNLPGSADELIKRLVA